MNIKRISYDFQYLYTWNFIQTNEEIEIKINFPKTFNPKSLKFSFENNSISLILENEVPIIMGELYSKIENYQIIYGSDNITYSFIKKNSENWPIFISNYYPNTKLIDPHSAFDLFLYLTSDQFPEEQINSELAQNVLSLSMQLGYLPALLYGVSQLEEDDSNLPQVITLLSLATFTYQNPIAAYKLGIIYNLNKENRLKALQVFQISLEKGIIHSGYFIGLILSPLSNIEFDNKDPETALRYFEIVLKSIEDPLSYFEAAKLLESNLISNQNIEKSKNYFKKAFELDNSLKPIINNKINLTEIISISALIILFGTFTYKFYKKFKK